MVRRIPLSALLALAALETGPTNLTRRTVCRGYFMLPNSTHRYRDWKPEGHGIVDIHDAIISGQSGGIGESAAAGNGGMV